MSTHTPNLQRNFIIGDEWLYLKVYTGYKSSESILREAIYPLTNSLLNEGLIDKWFFIRYNDPKYHLRVRFHLTERTNIAKILLGFNDSIKDFVDEEIIWKVQADTYQREIERYGSNSMELAENLFFADSVAISELIISFSGNEDENRRWLFAMKMTDIFLSDFGYDMQQKMNLLQRMQESYSAEFEIETFSRQQLSSKYRANKMEIEKTMSGEILSEYHHITSYRSEISANTIEQLIALYKANQLEIPLLDLMPSYIHMQMNRLFRTNQRKNELVIYDFLYNYYKSQIAREKYKTQSNTIN